MLNNTIYSERKSNPDPGLISNLASKLDISPIMARLLLNRGIHDEWEAEAFLYPNRNSFHDPFALPDMEKAVDRIKEAIECEERILIYGDYDTDGICATAILYKTLLSLGADVECYIPNRHTDGYGMNKSIAEEICSSGIDLIITVDNGITAIDEIRVCTDFSVSVIVTDHHIPRTFSEGESLGEGAELLPDEKTIIPQCEAVIVPLRTDSDYPCKSLCGAGVVFKLSCALLGKIDFELLGLAAIATVADVVSLTDENRTIVKLGLPYVDKNLGVRVLLDNAGVQAAVNEQTIAFAISPRINAAGRMGDANRALRLLITDDEEERALRSDEIEEANNLRREEENKVAQEILSVNDEQMMERSKVIVLKSETWNPGVLGIAASKLVDTYNCPVILFTRKDGQYVGSGRSIRGIHLHDLLTGLKKYFVRYGGHAMAAGVTIADETNLDAFIQDIQKVCSEIEDKRFVRALEYDERIDLSDITDRLCTEIEDLAPFGEGNPYPSFLSQDLSPVTFKKIGKSEDHLSGSFRQKEKMFPFVAFKMGNRFAELDNRGLFKVLYSVCRESYQGVESIKLRLVDFQRKADAFLTEEEYNKICCFNSFTVRILRPERFETIEKAAFTREMMMQSYRRLSELIGTSTKTDLSIVERIRLCVFYELGFFVLNENGKLVRPQTVPKRSLNESGIYQLVVPN